MEKVCVVRGDLVIVKLSGDLDHHVTELIRNEIDETVKKNKIYNIAFDFRNVGFMDSSGIGLLMGRYKKIRSAEGKIYVCNLSYTMQRIFKLSGLYKITNHSFDIDHIVNQEVTYEQNEN